MRRGYVEGMQRTQPRQETKTMLANTKVHIDYQGRGINLCGTLTKHGRLRVADKEQATCDKCLAKAKALEEAK